MYDLVKVCASFFYNTLDISWKMVQAAKQYFKDDSFRRAPRPETRGGANKISSEILAGVRRHIKSFKKVPSHWCRKRTKKGYLSSDLNIQRMFNLYQQQCLDSGLEGDQYASVHTYRKVSCTLSRLLSSSVSNFNCISIIELVSRPMLAPILTTILHACVTPNKMLSFFIVQVFCEEFNLSFHQPSKDDCGNCTRFDSTPKEEKTLSMKAEDKKHRDEAKAVHDNKDRDQLRAQREDDFACGSFDLMQVCLRSLMSLCS